MSAWRPPNKGNEDKLKNEMIERFTSYVKVDTQSNEESGTCPSTPGQLTLARMLVDELKTIGIIRDGESEHQAANQTHPGRHRRFTAFLYGAANTEYFHRRRKLPRQVRIYFSRQHGKSNQRYH